MCVICVYLCVDHHSVSSVYVQNHDHPRSVNAWSGFFKNHVNAFSPSFVVVTRIKSVSRISNVATPPSSPKTSHANSSPFQSRRDHRNRRIALVSYSGMVVGLAGKVAPMQVPVLLVGLGHFSRIRNVVVPPRENHSLPGFPFWHESAGRANQRRAKMKFERDSANSVKRVYIQ
jgi:hypothetical protein